MTNGDYAFFSFNDQSSLRPWASFDMSGQDVSYRMRIFYAVKQVLEHMPFKRDAAEILHQVND
jgi:hypothetical protein